MLEAARNLVCVGAEPKAVTNCLNFGNPEKPEVMWSFSESVKGLSDACIQLQTPVVSGNVSFYNETEGRPILPTPTIAMVGVLSDIQRAVTMSFKRAGDQILLLGSLDSVGLGGSELQLMETGALEGRPPKADFDRARAVHRACLEGIQTGLLQSAHDLAEGGFLVALAECCVSGPERLGARVQLDRADGDERIFFGEGPSVIIVSAGPAEVSPLLAIADKHDAPASVIGEVGGAAVSVNGEHQVLVADLADAWENGLCRALRTKGTET